MSIPVLSVVAKSGTGKTTLLERVIPRLKKRGISVAVIKHDAHNFEIDIPGKDSWRLAQAGADIVCISSKEKFAYIDMRGGERSLDQLVNTISDVDIILTEGFRTGGKPKIEVYRQEVEDSIISNPEELIAIAGNKPFADFGVPIFDLNDIEGITELIIQFIQDFNAKAENQEPDCIHKR